MMILYLVYGIFNGSRLDEAFVQTSARYDRVFETFSLVLLDVLRCLALHTETQRARPSPTLPPALFSSLLLSSLSTKSCPPIKTLRH